MKEKKSATMQLFVLSLVSELMHVPIAIPPWITIFTKPRIHSRIARRSFQRQMQRAGRLWPRSSPRNRPVRGGVAIRLQIIFDIAIWFAGPDQATTPRVDSISILSTTPFIIIMMARRITHK